MPKTWHNSNDNVSKRKRKKKNKINYPFRWEQNNKLNALSICVRTRHPRKTDESDGTGNGWKINWLHLIKHDIQATRVSARTGVFFFADEAQNVLGNANGKTTFNSTPYKLQWQKWNMLRHYFSRSCSICYARSFVICSIGSVEIPIYSAFECLFLVVLCPLHTFAVVG